jgi:hypothetical protein
MGSWEHMMSHFVLVLSTNSCATCSRGTRIASHWKGLMKFWMQAIYWDTQRRFIHNVEAFSTPIMNAAYSYDMAIVYLLKQNT